MVLLYFSALVVVCVFIGWGVRGILDPNKDAPPSTTLALGYALGVVVFFPAYFVLSGAAQATLCVLLLASAMNVIYACRIWRKAANVPTISCNVKRDCSAYALFAFVVLFSAVTYVASGAGEYWHTANEDIFDGLNGRSAYVNKELLDGGTWLESSSRVRATLDEALKETSGLSPQKNTAFFKERYVHDLGRLQYSSLAFIAELLKLPKGMDVFLLQALLNLGLFALGVHAFVRRILNQPQALSIAVALMAVTGNFYLATYFNGHEGSLMYNAVVPFIFYFLVKWIRDSQHLTWILVIPALLLVMVIGAYPYPLPYLVAPVALYYAQKRFFPRIGEELTLNGLRQHKIMILTAVLIAVLAFIVAYLLAEPIRARALGQFRSWGTIHNHVGFLQFWGIWPSNLAYTSTPLGWLNAHLPIKIFSLFLASALSLIAIYGGIRLVNQRVLFLLVWLPIAALFFCVMRFVVYDSYYLYKYLYINAWIVYALTTVGLVGLAKQRHFVVKFFIIFTAVCWAGANLANNTSAMREISSKSFNKNPMSYQEILYAPRDVLKDSYIAIPQNDHADLVRQILSENGIVTTQNKANAHYMLIENGHSDVLKESQGKVVWESKVFSLVEMPERDVVELASYWGVEGADIPFRWVSDGRNGTLMLGLYKGSEKSKYLFLCGESGPGVSYRPVSVKTYDAKDRLVGTMSISAYGCHTVDVSKYQPPFSLVHNETGVISSYIDQRKLVYRIMHIGFSPTKEFDETYLTLSSGKDIVDGRHGKQGATPRISLGANWHSFETYQGESFRWASDYPEIIVSGSAGTGTLSIDVTPGPSVGKEILNLELLDASDNVAGKCIVGERRVCTFPILIDGNAKSKYRFHSDALGITNSDDPRILNFRVFNIGWQQ